MISIKHRYAELLHLTQLFLLREYSLKDVKMVEPPLFAFFQRKMQNFSSPIRNAPSPVVTVPPVPSSQVPVKTITIPPSPDPGPSQPPPKPTPPPEPLPPPTQPEPVIPPSPPPAIQGKSTHKGKEFSLEPWNPPSSSRDHRELWKVCQTLFPEWTLCEAIPSDAIAQKQKNAWQRNQDILPIILLSFHDHEQQVIFLKNIAQAISLRLAPAKVLSASQLEKENSWENLLNSSQLRLVIASDYGLYLYPKLMRFYREMPQQNRHFLHQTPLLLLSDLSLYLREPQLKPLLWRAICNEFAALKTS